MRIQNSLKKPRVGAVDEGIVALKRRYVVYELSICDALILRNEVLDRYPWVP